MATESTIPARTIGTAFTGHGLWFQGPSNFSQQHDHALDEERVPLSRADTVSHQEGGVRVTCIPSARELSVDHCSISG